MFILLKRIKYFQKKKKKFKGLPGVYLSKGKKDANWYQIKKKININIQTIHRRVHL